MYEASSVFFFSSFGCRSINEFGAGSDRQFFVIILKASNFVLASSSSLWTSYFFWSEFDRRLQISYS